MTPRPQPADIIDAYTQWAISSIDAWVAGATAVADKIDQGSYTPADFVAEASAYTSRMVQAARDLYENIVTGVPESTISSEDFTTTPPAKAFIGGRTLRLAGPLKAQIHPTTIAATLVKIVPSTLADDENTFHLEVDPTNLPGDAYWGTVEVVTSGTVTETRTVVIQIP